MNVENKYYIFAQYFSFKHIGKLKFKIKLNFFSSIYE